MTYQGQRLFNILCWEVGNYCAVWYVIYFRQIKHWHHAPRVHDTFEQGNVTCNVTQVGSLCDSAGVTWLHSVISVYLSQHTIVDQLVHWLLISAPRLGAYYLLSFDSVCPSVCLSRSFKLLLLFCFLMESSHFLAVSSPCGIYKTFS